MQDLLSIIFDCYGNPILFTLGSGLYFVYLGRENKPVQVALYTSSKPDEYELFL